MREWLRNKLLKFIFPKDELQSSTAVSPVANYVEIDGMNFNVMQANGGVIVQLRKYDRKTDRNNHSTHIITDNEDLAERIGQIVALEMLRS
jgi:hypothetical protein